MFAALGDETRLALVARLCASGALTITELAQDSGVTRQAVTKHLHVLESAGVARGRRRGRTQMWELRARPLDEARRTLDRIAREWHGALARRKDAVEGDG